MKIKQRVSADEMREYAKEHGALAAYELLLLGGYSFLAGSKEDYNELLKEFESVYYWGNSLGNGSNQTCG